MCLQRNEIQELVQFFLQNHVRFALALARFGWRFSRWLAVQQVLAPWLAWQGRAKTGWSDTGPMLISLTATGDDADTRPSPSGHATTQSDTCYSVGCAVKCVRLSEGASLRSRVRVCMESVACVCACVRVDV